MVFAIGVTIFFSVCLIILFLIRKRFEKDDEEGAFKFKLLVATCCLFVALSWSFCLPVYCMVDKYEELLGVNVKSLNYATVEYQDYIDEVRQVNSWILQYKDLIEEHPYLTFCNNKISELDLLEVE